MATFHRGGFASGEAQCKIGLPTILTEPRGYESQFSTNHLGQFQLATRLWPALRRAQGARVIAVSSRGHRIVGVDLEDPNFERRAYDPWIAYGQSKTANVLFALKLDELGQARGIRAFSVHPGAILTNLSKYMSQERLWAQGAINDEGQPVTDPARGMKSVEQGAATSVWCAISSQLDGLGGVYCEDCDIAVAVPEDFEKPHGVWPRAIDPEVTGRLWSMSEDLTSVRHLHWPYPNGMVGSGSEFHIPVAYRMSPPECRSGPKAYVSGMPRPDLPALSSILRKAVRETRASDRSTGVDLV